MQVWMETCANFQLDKHMSTPTPKSKSMQIKYVMVPRQKLIGGLHTQRAAMSDDLYRPNIQIWMRVGTYVKLRMSMHVPMR